MKLIIFFFFLPVFFFAYGKSIDPSQASWHKKYVKQQNAPDPADMLLNTDPEPLLVRRRRPGDRYQPLGMDCDVKLQDILVNRKVPVVLRDHLPVVVQREGTIMWCPGCPGPEQFKLIAPQDCALVLEYKPEGTATYSGTKSFFACSGSLAA